MHYVVVDLKTERVGHSIRPFLYLGKSKGIYAFDEFEYKEIEIEDGMKWLQSAPDRIRRSRMGHFQVTFVDDDGWPIDYGTAAVALRRHAFPLGVSLQTKRASHVSDDDYRWYLTAAIKHFWTGTLAEQLQWYAYEPAPGDAAAAKREVADMLTWAERQGWSPLSAALLDGGHTQKGHWANKLTCGDLELHLRERLMRDLHAGSSGFGGRFGRYEVWKDVMTRHKDDWLSRCGDNVLFSAYRWAHMADPAALLSTAESDILTTQTLTNAEAYHNLIWEMAKNKDVPVTAIGVRANFTGEVDASTVKHRLDVLQEVG